MGLCLIEGGQLTEERVCWSLVFQRVSPWPSRQGTWKQADRQGTGAIAESLYTKSLYTSLYTKRCLDKYINSLLKNSMSLLRGDKCV